MYPGPRIEGYKKSNPLARWNLIDRVFFACGACHILAYAFLEQHKLENAKAIWIKPDQGYTGNHIFVDLGRMIFDYHGYSNQKLFLEHTFKRARQYWAGWNAELIELPRDVLISEKKSKSYDGLWLREPKQFLHDALPRARMFLDRFPDPHEALCFKREWKSQGSLNQLIDFSHNIYYGKFWM